MGQYDNLKKGEKGAIVSITAYLFLSCIKLIIAYVTNSAALQADGLNNTTDVIASVAVLVGLRISQKPPDEDHHYGHFRAETIASLIAAFIMATVGIQVIANTFRQIIENSYSQPGMLAGWTALGGAAIMLGVHRYNLQLSKKIKSASLYAASQDNKSDALVSLGAFIGIAGAQFGAFWLDPVAGMIVGVIICKTAWDIFRDSTHLLTDGFNEDQLYQIKESIRQVHGVKEIKDIKGRLHGNQALIEVTILVELKLNVQESHDITVQVEKLLAEDHDVHHAHIHIEPFQ